MRDDSLANQIGRLAEKKWVCPLVVRAGAHSLTLEPALRKQRIEFEVLERTGASGPWDEVVRDRTINGTSAAPFSEEDRLRILRDPFQQYLEFILRQSIGETQRLTTSRAIELMRPIVNRWTEEDLIRWIVRDSGTGKGEYLDTWIDKNCSGAEKKMLHQYRTLAR